MTQPAASASDRIWQAIDTEKRRDRLIRRISIIAWSVTVTLVLLLGLAVGIQIAEMAKGAMLGVLPWMSVIGVAMPFIIVLGLLSTLIATLATVGMFLRLRTTSLNEIQLRLAALEDMIASRGDGSNE
jgi:hypothetical protein